MGRTLCYVGILIEDVCVSLCCELNLYRESQLTMRSSSTKQVPCSIVAAEERVMNIYFHCAHFPWQSQTDLCHKTWMNISLK